MQGWLGDSAGLLAFYVIFLRYVVWQGKEFTAARCAMVAQIAHMDIPCPEWFHPADADLVRILNSDQRSRCDPYHRI